MNSVPLAIAQEKAIEQRARMIPNYPTALSQLASWHSIGPHPANDGSGLIASGVVFGVAIDPRDTNTVYAATADGGLWKTTDGGDTWSPLTDNQPDLQLSTVTIDPKEDSTLYVGTGNQFGGVSGIGIMKSTDCGVTWSVIPLQAGLAATVKIIVNPDTTSVIYAATTAGVYKSTDGGTTWNLILSGTANDLVMDTTTTETLYAGISGEGLYKTTDGGISWARETDGLPSQTEIQRMQLGLCLSSPRILYAGIYSSPNPIDAATDTNRIYKSTDGGLTWHSLTDAPNYGGLQGWFTNYIKVDPSDPNVVYAGGTYLWRTTDGGNTWAMIANGSNVHVDQHALAFDPSNSNRVFVGNDGGIYSSTDRGSIWSNLNRNLVTLLFYGLAVDPHSSHIVYGGTQDNGMQRRTSEESWQLVVGGDAAITNVDYNNSDTVYSEFMDGYHLKSIDGGYSFSPIMNGIPGNDKGNWVTPVAMNPQNPQTLYTGTTRFYRTTDGGLDWTTTGIPVDSKPSPQDLSAIGVAPSNPSIIYVGAGTDGVYRTFNGGSKWINVTNGLPPLWISDIVVDPDSENYAYVTMSGYGARQVYKTTDGGNSWESISANLPDTPVNTLAIDPTDQNTLYIGTDIGIFMTADQGKTWAPIVGLPNVQVTGLEFTPTGSLIASTMGRGMWEYSPSDQVVISTTSNPPSAGTVSPAQMIAYQLGDTVTLIAIAHPGYTFGLWGGDTLAHNDTLRVIAWKNMDLVANFLSHTLPQNAYYTSKNSDYDQIPFEWVELSEDSSAAEIQPGDWHNSHDISDPENDGTFGPVKIGMPFYFYGESTPKEKAFVGADGVLSLSQDNLNDEGFYNPDWVIPGAPINDLISPFWNNIYMTPGKGHGTVYYTSDSLNNRFVIEWYRVGNHNCASDTMTTFEIILNGENNSIIFQYLNVGTTGLDSTALVGLQRDSTDGLLYYSDDHSRSSTALKAHDSLAIEFVNQTQTVVAGRPCTVPEAFQLEQNYPDPFNPSTTIEYFMPSEENVSLLVYNVLGQKVATLVEGVEQAGQHLVQFDGGQLASGVYFYRIRAGAFVRTMKMVVLK